MTVIKDGDFVLLYLNEKKNWVVEVRSDREFHTHVGIVRLGDVVGSLYGGHVKSTLGFDFYLLWPTLRDRILDIRRPTQIMYDKDIGLAMFRLGLSPGQSVVEAGTGSGAMTASLASVVRPEGHVYSYEIRPEYVENAKRNLTRIGLEKYVTLNGTDARLGFAERDVDAVFIDLGDPWEVVEPAHVARRKEDTQLDRSVRR